MGKIMHSRNAGKDKHNSTFDEVCVDRGDHDDETCDSLKTNHVSCSLHTSPEIAEFRARGAGSGTVRPASSRHAGGAGFIPNPKLACSKSHRIINCCVYLSIDSHTYILIYLSVDALNYTSIRLVILFPGYAAIHELFARLYVHCLLSTIIRSFMHSFTHSFMYTISSSTPLFFRCSCSHRFSYFSVCDYI